MTSIFLFQTSKHLWFDSELLRGVNGILPFINEVIETSLQMIKGV